jgi:hypothetical protein
LAAELKRFHLDMPQLPDRMKESRRAPPMRNSSIAARSHHWRVATVSHGCVSSIFALCPVVSDGPTEIRTRLGQR